MQFIGTTPTQMIIPGEYSGWLNDIKYDLYSFRPRNPIVHSNISRKMKLNDENYPYLSAVIFIILFSTGGDLPALESDNSSCDEAAIGTVPDYYPDWPASFGIGTIASTEEINTWDMDVTADGAGLPDGKGTVSGGSKLYSLLCQSCHGENGQGKPFDALAGHDDAQSYPFPDDKFAAKTIGNYWPYATTLFDYINRSMPFASPGSLSSDEVYSITAYLLYLNKLIPEETVLTAENLASIDMPARNRFVADVGCKIK